MPGDRNLDCPLDPNVVCGEGCAWWVPSEKECAICTIAYQLRNLYQVHEVGCDARED